MARATIDDVAKAAGVSTFTVSRALRGKEHVADATREKVLKAAKDLNYTASKSASALASGRTNRIALLVRERMAGWFMGELFDGIYDVLSSQRYDLTVYRAGNAEERATFFTNLPANRNADALIVSGFSATDEETEMLSTMDIPIVSVNSPYTGWCQASVAIDDEAAEATIVRYLAALGHRRFCYISRIDPLIGAQWGFDARARGYNDEIASLGLKDCGIFFIDPHSLRSVKHVIAELLALPEGPTALCVWSDYHAVSVMHELHEAGIRIPDEMSVFGFDGADMAATFGLSTMAQPARNIGRLAARKALALIAGKTLDEPHTTVPVTLEPGSTTGPWRAEE
ncbi:MULTISPECIES: LacI family DNA-binding transcriptional regulator [Bifidobacterium]|jgi:DNA-binding LacI/PurR family transcriptional regulator|uniref:LacI family transcriptional regulator n=1 Tax=Bifidobacterium tibiigranuli TaxID=2172043 RepID=A0A5N6S7U6_9BIFI|nr:LacI family DNA-binding transcriptional regulator [Bifidobacterium tibiigranuli]KAE8129555.1 LacI family transcriptional regulator [Bifidobacterium tibiigranuli]KAE8129919.1 LacI family transcriptional regulator [Bifidobacterium tibiigranuli]MCH3975729.1 LacI family transcriptional regulator [Bifidobacterium tibiigranuli]MCH4189860.1 LacI family transcriptional regulator [Bifidobacterium tibiigranuli]MCH4203014.1 LacI family transcriptional regulator [Bifidobacterium tibiigranuli]